jgi:predicted MFS family arabinose efflux permease
LLILFRRPVPFRCRQHCHFPEWGLSDAQSARLLSIFGLTFALGAPLAQVLFGKLMRRTQVLAGMLVFGLGPYLPLLRTTEYWWFPGL